MSDITKWMDAARWVQRDPVLGSQQVGFERETGKSKVGDGITKWTALPYSSSPPYVLPDLLEFDSAASDLSAFNVYIPDKYGAKGDGTTLDTAAVQECFAACPVNGKIYLGKQYLIDDEILVPSFRSVIGSGDSRGGLIVKTGANLVAALLSAAYASNSTASGGPVTIREVHIKFNSGNTTGSGILLMNYYSEVSKCSVGSPPEHGIVMADQNAAGQTITNTAVENRINDNRIFTPGKHGIWVQDKAAQGKNTDGYLKGNIVAFSGEVAIRHDRAAGWFIDDNHVYACGNALAPSSYASVAGAGGFDLRNCWNTYITNNEVDGFGNVTNAGTHIAFNIEQLNGRPSVIIGNIASANEALRPSSNYIYYRLTPSGSGGIATVIMDDNIAHCDSTGGASSVGMSLQPNSGTLNVKLAGHLNNGPATLQTIGSPGAVNVSTLAPPAINGVIETMSRDHVDVSSGSPSPSAGTLGLTYFSADQSMNVASLISASRATAQAGSTLARMALFSVDAAGNLTCIARTASDPTLWQATNTAYSRPIVDNGQGQAISSVAVTAGQRLAFAILHVASTTAPTLAGKGGIAGLGSLTPRRSGYLTGQTDVPASITAAAISANVASGNYYYGRLA